MSPNISSDVRPCVHPSCRPDAGKPDGETASAPRFRRPRSLGRRGDGIAALPAGQPFAGSGLWWPPLALLVGTALCGSAGPSFADAKQDAWVDDLAASFASTVDGMPLRAAIDSIAEARRINVWLHRSVDPSARVAAGTLGPTVFAALRQIAASTDLVAIPVSGVILIGPTDWADPMAVEIGRISTNSGPATRRSTIRWPQLTTPNEALAAAGAAGDLPHDLWPARTLRGLGNEVVAALIRGEFRNDSKSRPSSTDRYVQHYPILETKLRRAVLKADPDASFSTTGRVCRLRATPAAHREAATVWTRPKADPSEVTVERRFDLQRARAPAGTMMRQLAAAAGKAITILPNAEEACETIVELSAKDKTLPQLIDTVADRVGVEVQRSANGDFVVGK